MIPAIEARGLTRTFAGPTPVQALIDCDVTVMPGEFCAVVGTSGSGKSTLLNLLGLLDRPTSGALRLNGVEVGGLTERRRAMLRGRYVGFVFQSFHLLDDRPAIESVMMAGLYLGRPPSSRRRAALAALEEVGLADKKSVCSRLLSGGERQRVAIARALAMNPTLLLCDEPTGNLDSANSEMVLSLLRRVRDSGRTLLIVTHDREIARRCDRMVVMRDGRLQAT